MKDLVSHADGIQDLLADHDTASHSYLCFCQVEVSLQLSSDSVTCGGNSS
jgi:hypothetical protein